MVEFSPAQAFSVTFASIVELSSEVVEFNPKMESPIHVSPAIAASIGWRKDGGDGDYQLQ